MSKKLQTASDLMSSDVVMVGPRETLREAMALMVENHVGALPVIDNKDRCVGVITATDILSQEYEQAEAPDHDEVEGNAYFDADSQRWENINLYRGVDEIPDLPVGDVMSDDIVCVGPRSSVSDVAQAMVTEGIHHVLVIDDQRRLHGIISSLDLVRLVAEG